MYAPVVPGRDDPGGRAVYREGVETAPISVRLTDLVSKIRRTPPWLIDAVIATAFIPIALGAFLSTDATDVDGLKEPDALGVVLTLACVLPYYFRRRAPLVVFLVSAIPFSVLLVGDYSTGGPAQILLIGTYTIAAYSPARDRLIAILTIATIFLIIAVTDIPELDAAGIFLNIAVFTAGYFFGATVRNRRLYTEQLEARAEAAEREREEEAERAVADERLRIAQELHDVVAHSMGVIAVQAGVGAHVIDTDPAEAKKSLEAISTTSRGTLMEIRRILGVLRDDKGAQYQPAPGLANLDWIVRDMASAGIEVDVTVQGGEGCELPPGVDLTAFRIVQEALTNVLKHAGPAKASVLVAYEPDALRLEIVDDGRGVNGRASGGGHGLLGMRERVGVYGGAFEAGPRAGGGFKVAVRLPYGSDG
jgi:signal transduction histidine kinase